MADVPDVMALLRSGGAPVEDSHMPVACWLCSLLLPPVLHKRGLLALRACLLAGALLFTGAGAGAVSHSISQSPRASALRLHIGSKDACVRCLNRRGHPRGQDPLVGQVPGGVLPHAVLRRAGDLRPPCRMCAAPPTLPKTLTSDWATPASNEGTRARDETCRHCTSTLKRQTSGFGCRQRRGGGGRGVLLLHTAAGAVLAGSAWAHIAFIFLRAGLLVLHAHVEAPLVQAFGRLWASPAHT